MAGHGYTTGVATCGNNRNSELRGEKDVLYSVNRNEKFGSRRMVLETLCTGRCGSRPGLELAGLSLFRPLRTGFSVGALVLSFGKGLLLPLPRLLPRRPVSRGLVLRAAVSGSSPVASAVAAGAAAVAPVPLAVSGLGAGLPLLAGGRARAPPPTLPGARPPTLPVSGGRPLPWAVLPLPFFPPP